MELRYAKNIGIILLNKQDMKYEPNVFKNISYLRTRMDLLSMDFDMLYLTLAKIRKDSYKVHIYVDGDYVKKDNKYPFILEQIMDILSDKKVYIHSFSNYPLFPNSDTLWNQEFSISNIEFLSVRKYKGDLRIEKYRREKRNEII